MFCLCFFIGCLCSNIVTRSFVSASVNAANNLVGFKLMMII